MATVNFAANGFAYYLNGEHYETLYKEEKLYAGVPSIEFNCTITILEQQINVWLIYYKEENRWALVYRRE